MSTMAAVNIELDSIFVEVVECLQITDTQYREAEGKYRAVGAWLADLASPLRVLSPKIYAQGSIALQTTVKPRIQEQEEYDLDFVLQVDHVPYGPMRLYEAVARQLIANAEYAKRIELMNRCFRLNYAKQFHLDILPACLDPSRGGTCILVPDRKRQTWMPSNPRGYCAWFENQSARLIFIEKLEQLPLPCNVPANEKPILKRVVQLLKRHRDVYFPDEENPARSIILTTLAASFYQGHESISEALVAILSQICSAIESIWPSRILVVNPTNPAERFCESWTDASYREFCDFIRSFHEQAERLMQAVGLENINARVGELFGEDIAKRSLDTYLRKFQSAREEGKLRATRAGLTTIAGVGIGCPKHTFYGD